jgi:hypothetical protein
VPRGIVPALNVREAARRLAQDPLDDTRIMRALPAWLKIAIFVVVGFGAALVGRYRITSSEAVEVSVLTSLLGPKSYDLPRAVFERLAGNVEIDSGGSGHHFYVTARQRRKLWGASNSGSSGLAIKLRAKRLVFGGLAPADILSATSDGVPVAGL